MKSAIGIGSLLMDGLGDTIRVSLTEDPEFEINPCGRWVRGKGGSGGAGSRMQAGAQLGRGQQAERRRGLQQYAEGL
jgi:hypothetical protein